MKKEDYIITVKNLTYQKILTNINLNIKKGSITSISGTNSSGKTTLLKILSGLLPTTNSVFLNDTNIEDINKTELYQQVSIIFPNNSLLLNYPNLETGINQILETYEQDKKNIQKIEKEIIKITDTKKIKQQNPNDLAYLEKLKFNLALSLAGNPQIIFIDNILDKLTSDEKQKIITILKDINDTKKITIVLASTNLEDTLLSDYIYILNQGQIALEGKTLEVLKKDNEINKLGLDIPFMLDLSVKLSDYDILNTIILQTDRMIDILWK